MVSFTILIALIALIPSAKCLVWNYCDNRFDVEIYQNDLTEPIKVGNPVQWDLVANLLRPMNGKVRTNVTLTRYVGSLAAPIRCMLINGQQAGSCSYPDLCDTIMYVANFSPWNCPPELRAAGIDCSCPFNLPAGLIDIHTTFETNTPAFMDSAFLVRGFYRLRVESSDPIGYWFCLDMEFNID